MSGFLTSTKSRWIVPFSSRTQARGAMKSKINPVNVAWLCVIAAALLNLLGIMAIDTVPRPDSPDFAMKHFQFMIIGMLAAGLIALPHYRFLQRLTYLFMILVLGMLVFVLMKWVPDSIVHPRNGARRWITLPFTDFQPSELAKIAYVLALASYLRFRKNYRTMFGLLLPLFLTFIPMGLIVVEPDLGTAMVFLPTFFAVLIAAGAKHRHLLIVILIGLSLTPVMYTILNPYQQRRILAMFAQMRGDDQYKQTIGFQADRAKTLVGAGGFFGVGKQKAAALVHSNHLPEEHNDMVFAVICCRWGVLGALATWGLFLILIVGGLLTSAKCRDPFGRLVAVGLVSVLFSQMLVNTGMTIGLLPITGLTLPFISYGGSSLVVAWMMVGLLLNIALRRPGFTLRHSFEFDEPVDDEVSFRVGAWRMPGA